MKEDVMGRECVVAWGETIHPGLWWGKLKARDYLDDLGLSVI